MGLIKKCPTCGTDNASSEVFCSNCNAMIGSVPLTSAQQTSTEEQQTTQASAIICPDKTCGHSNPPGSERCEICNSLLVASDDIKASPSEPPVPPQAIPIANKVTTKPEAVPYRTGGNSFKTLREIALYYATNWNEGMGHIDDNYLLKWAESNFPFAIDVDSLEFLKTLSRNRSHGDDIRLMQFITRFAPELPPVWKGMHLSLENLIAMLDKAVDGDTRMQEQIVEILERGIISAILDVRPDKELTWCLNATSAANESCSKAAQNLVNAGGPSHKIPTSRLIMGPALMLAAVSESHRNKLRVATRIRTGISTRFCPWFAVLGPVSQAEAGVLVLMYHLAGDARPIGRKRLTKGITVAAAVLLLVGGGLFAWQTYSSKVRSGIDRAGLSAYAATVKSERVNVRSAPSKDSDIICSLSKGDTVLVIEHKENWTKVRCTKEKTDLTGWVFSDLLQKTQQQPEPTPSQLKQTAQKPPKMVTVAKEGVNIYLIPSGDSKVIARTGKGSTFGYLQKEGAWIKIQISGNDPKSQGWVQLNAVRLK